MWSVTGLWRMDSSRMGRSCGLTRCIILRLVVTTQTSTAMFEWDGEESGVLINLHSVSSIFLSIVTGH